MKKKNRVPLAAVILAAGEGKRMKSAKSKMLHELCGRPLVTYSIKSARAAGADFVCAVISEGSSKLKGVVEDMGAKVAVQKKPMGTADAALSAKSALAGFSGYVLIVNGDVPLLKPDTIKSFASKVARSEAVCGVCTMKLSSGGEYGRIIRDFDGHIVRIVEAADATPDELAITEVNTGVYCVDKDWFYSNVKRVSKNNEQGEFYLTDIVQTAVGLGKRVYAHLVPDASEFVGVNDRTDLDNVQRELRYQINKGLQKAGVGIVDYLHTYIEQDVSIGKDTEIMPFTFISGRTKIGRNCRIENGVVIRNSVIADNVMIRAHSIVEDSKVSSNAVVGPFARLRPGSFIGEEARVGNFVEIKKSKLGKGAKANHHTYLGDSEIGSGANIGCGTITCNYDGRNKHKTVIGANAFVGSDTQFIAPVRIGSGAVIGAGSTITRNVPSDSLSLSRSEQKIIRGYAKRRKKRK